VELGAQKGTARGGVRWLTALESWHLEESANEGTSLAQCRMTFGNAFERSAVQ
jgi:hypothetical protein